MGGTRRLLRVLMGRGEERGLDGGLKRGRGLPIGVATFSLFIFDGDDTGN